MKNKRNIIGEEAVVNVRVRGRGVGNQLVRVIRSTPTTVIFKQFGHFKTSKVNQSFVTGWVGIEKNNKAKVWCNFMTWIRIKALGIKAREYSKVFPDTKGRLM